MLTVSVTDDATQSMVTFKFDGSKLVLTGSHNPKDEVVFFPQTGVKAAAGKTIDATPKVVEPTKAKTEGKAKTPAKKRGPRSVEYTVPQELIQPHIIDMLSRGAKASTEMRPLLAKAFEVDDITNSAAWSLVHLQRKRLIRKLRDGRYALALDERYARA